MTITQRDNGDWLAEGQYDDRFVAVTGTTPDEARRNWYATATGGMAAV